MQNISDVDKLPPSIPKHHITAMMFQNSFNAMYHRRLPAMFNADPHHTA